MTSILGNLAKRLPDARYRAVFLHPGDAPRLVPHTTKLGFPGYLLNLRSPLVARRPVKSMLAFLTYLPVTLYWLRVLISRHDIRIINIHYPIESFVYFAVVQWLLRVPLVISVHGADCFPSGKPMIRYPLSLRLLLGSAAAIVAPSASLLEDLLARFPRLRRKGLVIHNGVDPEELAAAASATPASARYILCIAAHNEKKGLDVLLQAFALLGSVEPPLRLVLVGDGPLRTECESLARTLRLLDRTDFLGWKGRAEVVRLLRNCEFLVLPSRAEPFGVVLVEAMLCGKAVLASNVGGIPEIIEDGQTGLLTPPDNPPALAAAMRRLLEDASLRSHLAQSGRAGALRAFTGRQNAEKYRALFDRLISRSSPRTRTPARSAAVPSESRLAGGSLDG